MEDHIIERTNHQSPITLVTVSIDIGCIFRSHFKILILPFLRKHDLANLTGYQTKSKVCAVELKFIKITKNSEPYNC
jgi:hypothetical protein